MHAPVWGGEDKPLRVGLHRLTPEERGGLSYDDLHNKRMQVGLRLEQEHIGSVGWTTACNSCFMGGAM